MKNYFKTVSPYVIVIAIMAIIIIFMQQCGGNTEIVEVETIVHKTDSIPYEVVIEKIKKEKEFVYVEVPVEIPQDVDTPSILADYYVKRFTQDTAIDNDTVALVLINDSIYKNRIQYRYVKFENRVPKIVDSIFVTKTVYVQQECANKYNIGIGGVLGGNTGRLNAGVSILLNTPKKASYSISYDVINKEAEVGIYWMLK